jgi:hypothetical protein
MQETQTLILHNNKINNLKNILYKHTLPAEEQVHHLLHLQSWHLELHQSMQLEDQMIAHLMAATRWKSYLRNLSLRLKHLHQFLFVGWLCSTKHHIARGDEL